MTEKEGQENSVEPNLVDIGEGIMQFYVAKIVEGRLPAVQKEMMKRNLNADPEYIMQSIKHGAMGFADEAANKFNAIGMLLLDLIIAGRISEVRDFETRFIDLLERTIWKDSGKTPVVINIPDSFLKSLEKLAGNLKAPSDD